MEITEREMSNAFRAFYRKLLAVLPVEVITRDFFSRNLLSNSHKRKIDSYSKRERKIKYFLDYVIYPSVQVGETLLFTEMLAAMRRSDDVTAKGVADKIKVEPFSPPSCSLVTSMGM